MNMIVGKQVAERVAIDKGKYRNSLTWLPSDFEDNQEKKYPLLITHPGSGETVIGSGGAAFSGLCRNGIPKMIADGWIPEAKNPNTGVVTQFIVLSVQQDSTGYTINPNGLIYAAENYPLIKDRYLKDQVFVTGLSLGGCATSLFFSDNYRDEWLSKVCALVPMSCYPLTNQIYTIEGLQKCNKPVWMFCGDKDTHSGGKCVTFFNFCKQHVPGIKTTMYPGGHNGWITQYQKSGFLEWCLSHAPVDLKKSNARVISMEGEQLVLEGDPITETCLIDISHEGQSGILKYIVR